MTYTEPCLGDDFCDQLIRDAHVEAEKIKKGRVTMDMLIQHVVNEIGAEVERARQLFPAIHNMHEGLGVIGEEFFEYQLEVFKFNLAKGRDSRPNARKELIQLAAMAVRTILDCDLRGNL